VKTKFLLTLLAINSLFIGINGASAYNTSASEIDRLSRRIVKSIDLDDSAVSLVYLAIERALIAQKIVERTPMPISPPVTAGVPRSNLDRSNLPPIIDRAEDWPTSLDIEEPSTEHPIENIEMGMTSDRKYIPKIEPDANRSH
jgi:hypothetical protein